MKSIKRKGFTLVELLIVIVVIGVLSAMMMLSSTEAVSSAKAAAIVSNLRNLKTAALAYYADNTTSADKSGFSLPAQKGDILKYLGDANSSGAMANYDFEGSYNTDWYVKLVNGDLAQENVQAKLAKRAADNGLYSSVGQTMTQYQSGATVYMIVRKVNE